MVCLNEKLPINIKRMKNVMIEEIDFIIEHELFYLDNIKIDENRKNKLKNNIIKEIKNQFNFDLFIYRIIDDEHCSFKHKRGSKDGHFCCRKIKKNKQDGSYLCATHNKNNIKNKRKTSISDIKESVENSISLNFNNTQENKNIILHEVFDFQNNEVINETIDGSINNKVIQKYDKKENIKYMNKFEYSNFQNKINNINNYNDNIYKRNIINNRCIYTKLIKEIPLLYFCINKTRIIKNKKNIKRQNIYKHIEKTNHNNYNYHNLSFPKNKIELY